MYIPRNISDNKYHLVAFDKAPSFDSSQVLGLGTLKPSGHEALAVPAVTSETTIGFNNFEEELNKRREVTFERETSLDVVDLNIFIICIMCERFIKKKYVRCDEDSKYDLIKDMYIYVYMLVDLFFLVKKKRIFFLVKKRIMIYIYDNLNAK